MTPKTFYVTTPIYYVNAAPHIGHAYTTILADVVTRYRRVLGEKAYFLTGTDEHGQKVEEAAKKRGVTPRVHCDETQQLFRDAWKRLSIQHDDFIRTTEPRHEKVVAAVLSDLLARGEIYKGEYEGWYDVSAEVFVPETEIEAKGLDKAKLKRVSEANYFFRMGKYRERLVAHIEANPDFIRPEHRKNEVLGFLKKGLGDLCISRPKARLSWGIPLPFDPEYVTYVWFDALLNYLTGCGYRSDNALFARTWPADVHLMGKDILTTHSVYWPTMLMAMGVPLPKTILAHGWWTQSGEKMSKTLGNVASPLEYADVYGAEALRYFLVAEMRVGEDAEFSDERFRARYEADLGNTWGNLLSRTVDMIVRFCGGKIPAPRARETNVLATTGTAGVVGDVRGRLDAYALHALPAAAMDLFRAANLLAEAEKPWVLAKDPAKKADLDDVLYRVAELLRVGTVLLSPILPAKCEAALTQLGCGPFPAGGLEVALRWGGLVPGTPVSKGAILFPRLDPNAPLPSAPKPAPAPVPAPAPGSATAAPAAPAALKPAITYDDFAKLDVRIGIVKAAEKHPKADRLLRLDVDIGVETRQILAGIAGSYDPATLVGRRVVVLANLAPKEIRGLMSNGMILAADVDGKPLLLGPEGEPLGGTPVK